MESGRVAVEQRMVRRILTKSYATGLCGRTRAISVRRLPTDHDYAARPANIRLINRRKSYLDRYPLYFPKVNNP
jgi:hypothetical protein